MATAIMTVSTSDETRAGSKGLKNQGWKDSGDAILSPNGRMVRNPIALADIQALYYAAKQAVALALPYRGILERAHSLRCEADALKREFNKRFWMPEERYYALALDPEERQVKSITADAGACLAYGIADPDKAEAVATRLMAPDLFSGWGLRTLSSEHPAYNPFAYHLGSVWPSPTAIAAYGLKRYGYNASMHRVAEGLFAAMAGFQSEPAA